MNSRGALNAFVQAAEARSFTIAGRQLGGSSSTIGKAVALVGERLGVRFVRWTGRWRQRDRRSRCCPRPKSARLVDRLSAQIVGWNGENLAFGWWEISDAVRVQRLRRRDSVERFTE